MSAPPVARLALAYAVGVGWGILGVPAWLAPLAAISWFAAPTQTSRWPMRRTHLLAAAVGLAGAVAPAGRGCSDAHAGSNAELAGRFLASPRTGSAPLARERCGVITVVTNELEVDAGAAVVVHGRWREGRHRPWLRADSIVLPSRVGSEPPWDRLRWRAVRWRDRLRGRIDRLYGARAPLVAALTLARREGLDPDLRESFARGGIAHLLAISGFHVGILAASVVALLRLVGAGRRRSAMLAAGLTWLYVAFIGFPEAACRAALILTAVAAGAIRGRPPARWGALGTSLLILLVLDPGGFASVGFQLSFLGAAGLTAWASPFTRGVQRTLGRRCPASLARGLATGAAATLATAPAVAWHFERVSLVGVPLTVLATPLVSLALPGALVTVALEPVAPSLARFLAGGVDVLLAAVEEATRVAARPVWTSAWVSRPAVVGVCAGWLLARRASRHPRIGAAGRRALTVVYVGLALVGWPVALRVQGWGTLQIVMVDVGQGDAIAVRSPRGRWILVDAGPPARSPDPGGHPVVRALRARGARRLEALVLTHADADHVGGASAVLERLEVEAVYDPALPAGKEEYRAVLGTAAHRDVPWHAARAGYALEWDGVAIDVLHPTDSAVAAGDTNDASVVLLVRFQAFQLLLTGDVSAATERALAPVLGDVEVLKVAHHGSRTSTDSLLLARTDPDVALISVGRGNRFGHPAPEVLTRLRQRGVEIHRTDQEGTIVVTARRDGRFTVRSTR